MKWITCILFIFTLMINAQEQSLRELKDNFMEPGPAWRGKPFWSWNGDLEKEELIRQIHVMKEMGMGGFFMHSRTGLKTEYLGDEWFDLINACADEAEKLDMEAWLYDDDRWPSGQAGGLVTQHPEYRAKLMTMHVFPPGEFEPDWEYDALFSCRLEGRDCFEVKKVDLEVSDYKAACLIADPDGADPGIIAWQPNHVDITGSLEGGSEIVLEAVITRRNTFGPLHHTPFNYTTGPQQFLTTGKQFTNDYVLYPAGIMDNPEIILYK